MEKRSQRRKKSEDIQDLGIDLENDVIEEEEIQEFEEDKSEETSIDSDFKEMPKVRIDLENNDDYENNNHESNRSANGLKWVLICILCIVLGVVIYGGYKFFFSTNNNENASDVTKNDTTTEIQDTEGPEFVGFLDRIAINLNAVDVDYSKYYLAVDNDQQMQVTVTGDVNLSQEGEYPITVSSTDEAGNTTSQDAIVQVISEETMVAVPIELTPMIDGSIPMAADTKQRVDANVIMYYYGEVSQEIKDEIARLGLDVSGYRLDSYWHPSDLNI